MAIRFMIRGDTIQLDQVLKAAGLCKSGGEAKAQVAAGLVSVDGKLETRKRAQLRPGQRVDYNGETIELVILAPGEEAPPRPPRQPRVKKPSLAPAKQGTSLDAKRPERRPDAKAGARPARQEPKPEKKSSSRPGSPWGGNAGAPKHGPRDSTGPRSGKRPSPFSKRKSR